MIKMMKLIKANVTALRGLREATAGRLFQIFEVLRSLKA